MKEPTFEYWYENKFSLEQRIKEPHLKDILKDTWEEAYFIGRDEGYGDGKVEGHGEGYGEGYSNGKSDGYDKGYDDGRDIETWS
jgi:flagellar biosynthesis/type III secretory pathway protein FliH